MRRWYIQQEVFLLSFVENTTELTSGWQIIEGPTQKFWTKRGAEKFIERMRPWLVLAGDRGRTRLSAQCRNK